MPENTPSPCYIAISQITQEDPTFNYPMIIQLVTFSEEKARQFIYQEDQKTQMKKIDSAAMNQYNPANTVVTKLNSDPNSNIRGMVVKNNGKIDPSAIVISPFFSFSVYSLNSGVGSNPSTLIMPTVIVNAAEHFPVIVDDEFTHHRAIGYVLQIS